ncbi:acetate/propionate family kinase [Desulfobacterales bacterium HSG17]|nr:acetate/propionate family kinase [Desulfobacterales bacterium HSG17]
MPLKAFLKNVSIFKDSSEEEIRQIADNAEIIFYKTGDIIKPKGSVGRYLWVVYDGRLEVFLEKEGEARSIAFIEKGEITGEMSLSTGEPSKAELVAAGDCQLLRFSSEFIRQLMLKNHSTFSRITQVITQRLVQREKDLNGDTRVCQLLDEQCDPYDLEFSSVSESIYVLSINCRISSLKYTLFNTDSSKPIIDGMIDRIGLDRSEHLFRYQNNEKCLTLSTESLTDALEIMLSTLVGPELDLLKHIDEIGAVGHRVVHGGDRIYSSTLIDDDLVQIIEDCSSLAPQHNPYNLIGIKKLREKLPEISHVAVFDTAFHMRMPLTAYQYALSPELNARKYIRRYGFHGTNHKYVALRAATYLKKPVKELKMISCHLGHGSSVCAIDHARSVDTSMGMTPLEGLVMGSRSGDIDPGVMIYLLRNGYSVDDLEYMLNHESGLKGLSKVGAYMSDVVAKAEKGNMDAERAIRVYCYRAKKYIGSYFAALNGVDVLIFTGGVGANTAEIRSRICQGLALFGAEIDDHKNAHTNFDQTTVCDIAEKESKTRILVIPSNDKRMIARETLHAIGRFRSKAEIAEYRKKPIPVNISAHHVHLTPDVFEKLFGQGRTLTPRSDLSQPGQFACMETVNLIGPKGIVEKVRILGPFRNKCQVEISRTEEFKLGIDAPVRDSGDVDGTPGIILEGETGQYKLKQGVICARRHIHMAPEDALGYGLKNKDVVTIRIKSERELVFGDVLIRVSPKYRLDMHIDTDEANAAEINPPTFGILEGIQSRPFV